MDEEEWTDFDEQQARTDALSLAITVSKVGTRSDAIVKKAQKFYEFIKKRKAKLHSIPSKQQQAKKD
jgi:hypothetical protein